MNTRMFKKPHDSAYRKRIIRNLAAQLVIHGKVETTLSRAKLVKKYLEPKITLAKVDNFNTRRKLNRYFFNSYTKDKTHVVDYLLKKVAPKYTNRSGGYLKIIRVGERRGDGCLTAIIQFT